MIPYVPRAGDTIFVPHTGGPSGEHLHVVMNDACPEGNHLLVPICSYRPLCDLTCVLEGGDHIFLNHRSYVSYAKALRYRSDYVSRMVHIGQMRRSDRCRFDVWERVCQGVLQSDETPEWAINYLKTNWPPILPAPQNLPNT